MDIESKDKHDVIYITMKHLNSQKSYTVIFEEHGAECFERKFTLMLGIVCCT